MDEFDWKLIQTLREEGSISKASEKLFISQPALSKRMNKIEEDLGCRVIIRTSKGVTFTESGEYLAQMAIQLNQKFESVRERISEMSESLAGPIIIGAGNYTLEHKLRRHIQSFQEKHPHVTFEIRNTKSKEINHLLDTGKIHVGFCCELYGWKEESIYLEKEEVVMISGEPINMDNISNRFMVDYETDETFKQEVLDWYRHHYQREPRISVKVSSLGTCASTLVDSPYFSIVPKGIWTSNPSLYKLHINHISGPSIFRHVWLLVKTDILRLRRIKEFAHWVEINYDKA